MMDFYDILWMNVELNNKEYDIEQGFKYVHISPLNVKARRGLELIERGSGYTHMLDYEYSHYLMNIPTKCWGKVKLPQADKVNLYYSHHMIHAPALSEYNTRYDVKSNTGGVCFLEKIQGTPKVLVVMFSDLGSDETPIKFPIKAMPGMFEYLDNILYISIQDMNMTLGSFYLSIEKGVPDPRYIEFIKGKLKEFNLSEQDLVLMGSSKGGTSALLVSTSFPKAKVIALCPLLNLNNIDKHEWQMLLRPLKHFGIEVDVTAILSQENKNIHYYSGKKDPEANNGCGIGGFGGISCIEYETNHLDTFLQGEYDAYSIIKEMTSDKKKVYFICQHDEVMRYYRILSKRFAKYDVVYIDSQSTRQIDTGSSILVFGEIELGISLRGQVRKTFHLKRLR